MPLLTRLFLRTSLIFLLAALAIAVMMALDLPPMAAVAGLFPTYLHLLIVGWVTQLIFGTAHWMFPRASAERPRGNRILVWGVYFSLNTGLLLRAVAEPVIANGGAGAWRIVLVVSAVLQWLAGLGFAMSLWPRVRGR